MDHLKLLCDFGELNWIFTGTHDIKSFLKRIVTLVIRHTEADACSIFLYREETDELVLEATEGLREDMTGKVVLGLGEGLTGLALKELRPIRAKEGRRHPSFKSFGGLDEELFPSYLAMPITRGINRVGVITLQRKIERPFNKEAEQTLQVIASQLANIIENARMLSLVSVDASRPSSSTLTLSGREPLRGSVASAGCVSGPSLVYDRDRSLSRLLAEDTPQCTWERYQGALAQTEKQLERLQGVIEETLDDAASLIFTSHLLILKDPTFTGEITTLIEGGTPPPQALLTVSKRYIDTFVRSPNPYVQEKAQDVEDIVIRIFSNLERSEDDNHELMEGCVVVARDLFPSDVLKFHSEKIAGILQVSGGVTSHVSILARSLEIPVVITDTPELMELPDGARVYLDGDVGNVYINPIQEVIETFGARFEAERQTARRTLRPETISKDGTRIHLMTNINLLSDMRLAMELGCEGVGLYRTEFPFLIRNNFPTEEEQFVIYKRIVDAAQGKEVVFRTLDIGGDKMLSYYQDYQEANPFLGMRSIRFSLSNLQVFKAQICAIIRASGPRAASIMFPMISSLDEFLTAKDILTGCISDLSEEGYSINTGPKVGLMVEVPSIVEIIDDLARHADFFSIGTNDFVQYMLGVDRANEKVAAFYIPHHPAVLRALNRIVAGAARHDRDIAVCGEMAHQRHYLAFLIGIGVRRFSMDAGSLPDIQDFVVDLDVGRARSFADDLLACGSVEETTRRLGLGLET